MCMKRVFAVNRGEKTHSEKNHPNYWGSGLHKKREEGS